MELFRAVSFGDVGRWLDLAAQQVATSQSAWRELPRSAGAHMQREGILSSICHTQLFARLPKIT